MSNAIAIAAVSAALCVLLDRRMAAAKSVGIVDSNAKVTAQPPDRLEVDGVNAVSRLNLFLYEVSPNSGWANLQLPSRDRDGRSITSPPLAIDLHYLLSAYGAEDLEAEILLGHGMQALHENPGLSRRAIRRLLDPLPHDATGVLPQKFRKEAVTLADQIEAIKISPRHLNIEEMSKVWTSLQAHYRPSAAYQVTVVLIESARPAFSALPVLTRGADDHGPRAVTSLIPPLPTLTAIQPPGGNPAARATDTVNLAGHDLAGAGARARFTHLRLERELSVTVGSANSESGTGVDLTLASPANSWAAGVWNVEWEVVRPGDTTPRRSNALPLVLAPMIKKGSVTAIKGANGAIDITLDSIPPLRPRQTASLIVGGEEFPPLAVNADTPTPKFSGTLPAPMLVAGTEHLLRLRVDGIDSLHVLLPQATDPPHTLPRFDPDQFFTMP